MLHPSFPFESERLIYRPYEDGDLGWLRELRLDEERMRFVPFGGETEDEILEVLARRKTHTRIEGPGDGIMCVMMEKETRAPVGEVMLRYPQGFQDTGEVGFILRRGFEGKGFATEGALEMMRLGFDEAGFHRIIGICDGENTASMAVLQRLGMVQEGLLRKSSKKNDEWRDQALFAALAQDWVRLDFSR